MIADHESLDLFVDSGCDQPTCDTAVLFGPVVTVVPRVSQGMHAEREDRVHRLVVAEETDSLALPGDVDPQVRFDHPHP